MGGDTSRGPPVGSDKDSLRPGFLTRLVLKGDSYRDGAALDSTRGVGSREAGTHLGRLARSRES